MAKELKIENEENREKVIKHLRRADYLFIFLPMVLAAILLIVVPLVWIITEKAGGNSGGPGGFNYSGLVLIAGIFFWAGFCGVYFLLAFVLSLLTRQNGTFRISLASALLLMLIIFFGWIYYLQIPPEIPPDALPDKISEYEKSALRFVEERPVDSKVRKNIKDEKI
jgi:cytochrome c biogenesis protein CcdA